jgi:tetratricopeptide (TPR) repeat protein
MASLIGLYQARGMDEVLLPWVERLIALPAINEIQRRVQGELSSFVLALRSRIQAPDSTAWKNRSELERLVTRFLDLGRVETAAELLETSYRPESRSWEITEQIATLRLHLGDTSGARRIWEEASAPPRPALRDSRIALTYLCDEDFEPARRHVAAALAAEPALFEALFLGAILESDAGDRAKAEALARRALGAAPGALAESAVQRLLRTIGPEAPAPAGNPEDEPPHSQPIN